MAESDSGINMKWREKELYVRKAEAGDYGAEMDGF